MTESALPFASDQTRAADHAEPASGARSRRPLLFAAAALLLALVVGAYFFAFSGGESATTTATKPVAAGVPRKPVAEVAKPGVPASPVVAPAPAVAVPPAVVAPLGRDPFKPLYVAPAVATGTVPGPAPVAGAAAPAAAGPAAPAKSASTTVALVSVSTANGKQVTQTKVGDASFSPAVGDVFAKTFKLVSIAGSCATYLNGDERFALCPGQTFQR